MARVEDGFFENPNEEQTQQQQDSETLNAIKQDTGAIREALYRFGGAQIARLRESERQTHQTQKQSAKQTADIVEAVRKGMLPRPPVSLGQAGQNRQKNAENNPLAAAENTQRDTLLQIGGKAGKGQKNRVNASEDAEAEKARAKKTTKTPQHDHPKTPPKEWYQDEQGKWRNKQGRYVSQKQLKQYGLRHDRANREETDTEKDARDMRIIEGLKDINASIESPENVDPLIDSLKEIGAPIQSVLGTTKTVAEVTGRGLGKLFGGDNAQRRHERLLAFLRRSHKADEKHAQRQESWLRRIWKKEQGDGGILGRIVGFFLLAGGLLLGLLKKGLGGLFGGNGIFKGAGKTVANLFKGGGLFKGIGKFFSGLFGKGGLLGGLFGGLGKLGGGLLKRIPVLGSLLAFSDNGMAGGIGAIVGGAIGTAFGPIGTIIGALFGEQIGVWLGKLDWREIGNNISEIWRAATQWFSTLWSDTAQWFGHVWKNVTQSLAGLWDTLTHNISGYAKEKWDGIKQSWHDFIEWLGGLIPDWLKNPVNALTEKAGQAAEWGIDTLQSARNRVSETWQTVKNRWNSDNASPVTERHTQESDVQRELHHEELTTDTSSLVSDQRQSLDLLGKIRDAVADIPKAFAHLFPHTEPSQLLDNGAPNPLHNVVNAAAGAVNQLGLTQGAGRDPKTGKAIRYTQGAFLGGNVQGLTQAETDVAMNALSARESGGNFAVENQYGYLGGYQFGASELAEVGLIDKQKLNAAMATTKGLGNGANAAAHKAFLADPSNWTISGGKAAFLNSKAIQDQAIVKSINRKVGGLRNSGIALNSAEDIVGAMFASHIAGEGAARNLYKHGVDKKDGNGTSAAYYRQYGKNALKGGMQTAKPKVNSPIVQTAMRAQKAVESGALTVPKVQAIQPDSGRIAQQVAKEASKPQASPATVNVKTAVPAAALAQDMIGQFLTQDVSDRRIAHIVTGGLALNGRI